MSTSVRSRRRGDDLERAIHSAVIAELAEVGFSRLTFEGVARRAGTAKTVLYRRWSDKTELVLDTMTVMVPSRDQLPTKGDVRLDLIALLEQMVAGLDGEIGVAVRALVGESHQDSELLRAIKERVAEPRRAAIALVLAAAVERGEIRRDVVTATVIDIAPALISLRHILDGHVDPRLATQIVDEVLLPVLTGNAGTPRT